MQENTLIIGIGSGGANIINNFIQDERLYADFCIIDNDFTSINNSSAKHKFYIEQDYKDKRNAECVLRDFRSIEYELKIKMRNYRKIYVIACLGGIFASSVTPSIIKLVLDETKLYKIILVKPFKTLGESILKRTENRLKEINSLNADVNIFLNEAIKIVGNKSMTTREFREIYNNEIKKVLLKNNLELEIFSQEFLNKCLKFS